MNRTEYFIPSTRGKKVRPEIGDEVTIRVKGQDLENPSRFIFEIEDPTYYGEGTMCIRNIVRYNLLTGEEAFRDMDGRPYLLKAKVLSTDLEGNLTFIMADMVNFYIRDMVSVGEETTCLITDIHSTFCLGVSEFGYSIQIAMTDEMEELAPGEYIKVQIEGIRPTGTIDGSYLTGAIEDFTVNDAFENLIMNYADEKVYEIAPEEEEENDDNELQQEVMMDSEYVAELINIIDRMAVLDTDYIRSYNYLAFARLLSVLLKDKKSVTYYTERMRLLQMLQHFVINGSVEQKKLEELTSDYSVMLTNYPILQSKLYELQLMACMDQPEKNNMIWELMSKTHEEHLENLCKLVISFNALKGFGMYKEREAIRKRINEVLNIQAAGDEPEYFGLESQTKEFKTTTVYPADNSMRVDVKAQTHELLKVICGFLNAEGGTLYLGVNNEGVAAGLKNDLDFFGGKDKLDLHIRNNIVLKFGNNANSRIKVHTSEKNDKYVYALDVLPSLRPVELDGICYQRQGTSTWPLLGDDLELFKETREYEVKKMMNTEILSNTSTEEEDNVVHVTTTDSSSQQAPADTQVEVKSVTESIPTSTLRENPINSWEDNFGVDTLCYLHLLPEDEFTITHEEYWGKKELSLCIKNDEDYLILVYENGGMIRVPISQIANRKDHTKYKRNKNKVVFACPAKSTDLIFSEVKGPRDNNYIRLDDVSRIKEGKITDGGEKLSVVENFGVVRCEILKNGHQEALRKIYNLKPTQLGHTTDTDWCKETCDYIHNLLKE